MEKDGDQIRMDTDEVRGAESTGRMWKVLVGGTFLAAAFMTVIWVTGALSQNDVESEATASGAQAAAEENQTDGDSTDSIIEPDDVQ